ncbi:MAG: dynamin family protein, partial [Chloroflexi bacterium]|nr:dynamin family protein [Chloroflexota bacterium]
MSETVLSDSHAQLLHQEKKVLGRVRDLILKTGDSSSELDTLSQAIQGLDQLFLLVVVGEYNSGKSSFINALVASKLFAEGVTPTTDRINVLRYGTREQVQELADGLIERTYPLEFLKQINLVDTPGTNAIMQRHQALSEGFIPRADFVLFITSADHPFTESERQFLEKIKGWGKKIVFVLNKVDILESDADLGRTVQFIADNARHLLGLEPLIFPVSSKLAFSAKAKGDKGMLRLSGFPKVEDYILHTLDERE